MEDCVELLLENVSKTLFSESAAAKIWGVALPKLDSPNPPNGMPEYSFGRYHYRDIEYWTAGFFPGSIAALLERKRKYPDFSPSQLQQSKLELAAKWWSENLKRQASRTDTHDLSFIIQPYFQREYETTHSKVSLEILTIAARSLASRFDERVGVIRSWDTAVNNRYSYTDTDEDFLVIIDNMCNLDMLYYVAHITGDTRLSDIATTHAKNTLKHHFRSDWSTYHVVNYDMGTGSAKERFTNQGFADESTWSRGQAWAILGFVETYGWTKDELFLEAAIQASNFFLSQIGSDGVPAWDFGAPDQELKDSSAAMIAVLGLLKIFQNTKKRNFLIAALKLLKNTIDHCFNGDAKFRSDGTVDLGDMDTILRHATINNNPDAFEKLKDHGLVYVDYYFLCVGNKILELGLLDDLADCARLQLAANEQ